MTVLDGDAMHRRSAEAGDPRPTLSARMHRLGIAALVVGSAIASLSTNRVFLVLPYGVDLEIPLRAAARWAAGGEPYLASSFQLDFGPELPFLYPPFLLPLVTFESLHARAAQQQQAAQAAAANQAANSTVN